MDLLHLPSCTKIHSMTGDNTDCIHTLCKCGHSWGEHHGTTNQECGAYLDEAWTKPCPCAAFQEVK